MVSPAATCTGALFSTTRSAIGVNVAVWSALLLLWTGSNVWAETHARLVTWPGTGTSSGTSKVTLIVRVAPVGTVPRSHTPRLAVGHSMDRSMILRSGCSGSTTWTPTASDGPLFVTVSW